MENKSVKEELNMTCVGGSSASKQRQYWPVLVTCLN